MPALLKNLRINTIGSVDYPANPRATVTLMKRGDPQGVSDPAAVGGTLEGVLTKILKALGIWKEESKVGLTEDIKKSLPTEVQKYLQELEAKAAKVDELEKKAAKVDELEKKLAELQKSADAPGTAGAGQQDIFKSLPEEVKKYVQEIEKRAKEAEEIAKKEREERLTREFVAKAAQFKALPVKPEEFGPVLKSISEVAPQVYEKVEAVLKAANELVEKSKVFDEIGKGTGVEKSAWGKIEAKASELVQKNAGMTKEQAIAQVLRQNPDLYAEYQKELLGE